ncbi:MAG: periplasmic heavy metal sensor [Chlorobiaceae bacterium]|nr:periplasmic heavy metal sensor [Chlorobiaceae bacterium]
MNRRIASVLLTGILCAGSVTALAGEPAPVPPPPPAPQAGAPGFMPCPGPARGGMGRQCFSMKQALGLTDKQDARLRELRQTHFQEAVAMRQELFRLQGDLAKASVERKPDEQNISELSGMIGRQHEKLALLQSRHLRAVASILDRKQVETLLRMKESRGMRGMPHGGRWQ